MKYNLRTAAFVVAVAAVSVLASAPPSTSAGAAVAGTLRTMNTGVQQDQLVNAVGNPVNSNNNNNEPTTGNKVAGEAGVSPSTPSGNTEPQQAAAGATTNNKEGVVAAPAGSNNAIQGGATPTSGNAGAHTSPTKTADPKPLNKTGSAVATATSPVPNRSSDASEAMYRAACLFTVMTVVTAGVIVSTI
ncbi:hypothetical protein RI367_002398 [Sorochytrium milnesiophthora]